MAESLSELAHVEPGPNPLRRGVVGLLLGLALGALATVLLRRHHDLDPDDGGPGGPGG